MEQIFVDKMTDGTRELGNCSAQSSNWSSFIAITSYW